MPRCYILLRRRLDPGQAPGERRTIGCLLAAREARLDVLRVILAWTAFAVFHSLTVSERYEDLALRSMGERAFAAYHRLLFTAYSFAAFILLVLYLRTVPDHPLYRLEGGGRLLFRAVQAFAVALLFYTPWDIREFLGIRQWRRHRNGGAKEPERGVRLFTGKAYGIVRHPLYLGISLILAFRPAQSRNTFLSTVLVILYFYVGTFFEERRMVGTFGQEYRNYQQRVPRFLPVRWYRKGVT
jgi:protein-S-isoprenylcysteine O-methyltransferase Ste14